tara:strand:- start:160 stop:396 length:237 start_codon:yes stop_codon:yes gene_type:complete
MENLNKYLNRIENAIKKLEKYKSLAKESNENIEQIKYLENEIMYLKKNKFSAEELIDQAVQEINKLRKNTSSKAKTDG